ncbi:hypothetical protein OPV22_033493 [Ensete ventricosum]|uniref:Uncharacterized protein n=1 Tax=Ensete ventricosum TaxID=4639 RepID=A0AAV8PYF8_ENSVE|nr:hypothetical protein OPV22_033493 [Ensete ventricosum]
MSICRILISNFKANAKESPLLVSKAIKQHETRRSIVPGIHPLGRFRARSSPQVINDTEVFGCRVFG